MHWLHGVGLGQRIFIVITLCYDYSLIFPLTNHTGVTMLSIVNQIMIHCSLIARLLTKVSNSENDFFENDFFCLLFIISFIHWIKKFQCWSYGVIFIVKTLAKSWFITWYQLVHIFSAIYFQSPMFILSSICCMQRSKYKFLVYVLPCVVVWIKCLKKWFPPIMVAQRLFNVFQLLDFHELH